MKPFYSTGTIFTLNVADHGETAILFMYIQIWFIPLQGENILMEELETPEANEQEQYTSQLRVDKQEGGGWEPTTTLF